MNYYNDTMQRINELLNSHKHMLELCQPAKYFLEKEKALLNIDQNSIPEYYANYLKNSSALTESLKYSIPDDFLNLKYDLRTQLLAISSQETMIEKIKQCISTIPLQELFERQRALIPIADSLPHLYEKFIIHAERIADAMASIEVTNRLYGLSNESIKLALQAPIAYQDFVCNQLARIKKDSSEIAQRRMIVTDLAGKLFESNEEITEWTLISGNFKFSDYIDSGPHPVSLYTTLDREVEYVYEPETFVNIARAFLKTTSVKISNLGREIVGMVFSINEFYERKSQPALFKPTNKTMRSCFKIPNIIARSENEFAEIVDHLYFLLYEGSGNAKRLSLIASNDVLKPLWNIKYLRHDFRHDLEHGSTTDFVKKKSQIGKIYRNLINTEVPVTPREWEKAQEAIYKDMSNMLKRINVSLKES